MTEKRVPDIELDCASCTDECFLLNETENVLGRKIDRRDFIKYTAIGTGLFFLPSFTDSEIKKALAVNPTVAWVNGGSCTGCTVAFIDYSGIMSVLSSVSIVYCTTIADVKEFPAAVDITIVEGASASTTCFEPEPTVDTNFDDFLRMVRSRSGKVLAVGTCASYGGIPHLNPDYHPVSSVIAVDGMVPGCPPKSEHIINAIVALINGTPLPNPNVEGIHGLYCPRKNQNRQSKLGVFGCVLPCGCKGTGTKADCIRFNEIGPNRDQLLAARNSNGIAAEGSPCTNMGDPCIGCFNSDFPKLPLYSIK